MRIAVMSDIHGYSLALARVLADLDTTGPFDAVIVAGDLCEVGPDPAGVLRLLREQSRGQPPERNPNFTVLTGNTDRDLVEAAADGHAGGELGFALEQIGRDGVEYLANLPFSHRVTPPGAASPAADLLAVHANPHDLERKLAPEMSDRELREVLGDAEAAVVAFGHHHVAFQRQVGDRLLVDVSAVGNPKDRHLRSRYGIFTWDNADGWSAEHRYVDYPLEETAAQIRASGLPDPEKTLRKLRRASY